MTNIDELRTRLAASRAALLEAVRGLTERDFATPLGDATVVEVLGALARQERETVRGARMVASAPMRPLPVAGSASGRPLPPQVVHDLAGARYETELLLDWLGSDASGEALEAVRGALEGIEARETATAAQIAGRAGNS
ncbi:MAG: hypothetical protein WCL53_08985 [Chloroflexota bacterium]